jgi:putative oxidoreductase
MKQFLFSARPWMNDLAIAILRIGSALMMLTHGWSKLINFSSSLATFRDPIGLGPAVSLQLAIFAEFFCAILLAAGLFTRLSLIPLIITMAVAAFGVHAADPFSTQEKSLLYLLIFITLLLTGPGKYSFDYRIGKRKRY